MPPFRVKLPRLPYLGSWRPTVGIPPTIDFHSPLVAERKLQQRLQQIQLAHPAGSVLIAPHPDIELPPATAV